jgi:hypothetical protein
MFGYVVDVAEPWFERQTDAALLSKSSPLHVSERDALAAALRGEVVAANVELSRSLFARAPGSVR